MTADLEIELRTRGSAAAARPPARGAKGRGIGPRAWGRKGQQPRVLSRCYRTGEAPNAPKIELFGCQHSTRIHIG